MFIWLTMNLLALAKSLEMHDAGTGCFFKEEIIFSCVCVVFVSIIAIYYKKKTIVFVLL